MDIVQLITVFAVVATNLGTVLALYLQLDRKLDESRKETTELIRSIHEEMRQFHGRMCALEERHRERNMARSSLTNIEK